MRWQTVTPREAALVILDAWFGEQPERVSSLPLTAYQRDAVLRLTHTLDARGGALLADAVGLGKTFVALAIIEAALQRDEQVAIVVPAALRRHWLQHLRNLPKRLRDLPRLITHTALSFGRLPTAQPALVVVDEAHAFRNGRTRRYQSLARLATSARVLLLTATPVNNRLDDLYHLIRVFAHDAAFHDLGVTHLQHAFRQAPTDPMAQRAVQRVIDAVMVRRTRAHVGNGNATLRFAQRTTPQVVRYDLVAPYGAAWPDIYKTLDQLTFAYCSATGDHAAAELMRMQLLKRLESSVAAFSISIQRQSMLCGLMIDALRQGCWIEPAALRSLSRDHEMGAQLPLQHLLSARLPDECDAAALREALQCDRARLQRCLRALQAPAATSDPKLSALHALLQQIGAGVIVFTQYRDTAVHLWKQLHRRMRVGLVHGSDARLGAQRTARSTVIECFAPRANGGRTPADRMRLDVLIATDVLAEGLNLQDAHTVVNYDIPWNPVTLMQRVGRVDRLGSPHDTVHVHNFLPDHGLDELLGLMERVERKLHIIQRTVGADAAILDLPHPGAAHAAIAGANGAVQLDQAFPEHDAVEELRVRWKRNRAVVHASAPVTSRIAWQTAGWLFVVRDGSSMRLLMLAGAVLREDVEFACRLIAHVLDGADLQAAPPMARPPWQRVLDWLAAEQHGRLLGNPRAQTEREAVRRLLAALDGQSVEDRLVRRADALLNRLAQPLDHNAQARLSAALLETDGDGAAVSLIARLEESVARAAAHAKQPSQVTPIAAIQLTSPAASLG